MGLENIKLLFPPVLKILYLFVFLLILHNLKLLYHKQHCTVSNQPLSLFAQIQPTKLSQFIIYHIDLLFNNVQVYFIIFTVRNLVEYNVWIIHQVIIHFQNIHNSIFQIIRQFLPIDQLIHQIR